MKHITYLLLAILLSSCSKQEIEDGSIDLQACFDNSVSYDQDDPLYRDYIENRTYWKCSNISNYQVTYKVFTYECYGGTVRLTVEDGEIVEEVILDAGQQPDPRCEGKARSIDNLFFVIETAVDSLTMFNDEVFVAYQAKISYDPIIHFPDTIEIDWEEFIQDDEFKAILIDFEEIK